MRDFSISLAALYNANCSEGPERLLFAINPNLHDVTLNLGQSVASLGHWRQLANEERFYFPGHGSLTPVTAGLVMAPLSCGLWICET
jgi:hypothetical protein